MDAKELIKAGNLSGALTQLNEEVKNSPSDPAKRTVLFQVLCYLGEWDKAERHLDLLAAQKSSAETGVQLYKNLIAAERERAEVARGERRPSFATKAPPYLELWFSARESIAQGNSAEAAASFARIEAELPQLDGTLNGKSFSGFKDLDASLSLFIELFIYERYLWVPVASLVELSVTQPVTLLDLLWSPGRIATRDGFVSQCYLPVLYPGTAASGDDRVRLGRVTEWRDLGEELYQGAGQHLYQAGGEEVALLELRELRFSESPEGGR
jgi:type VI secretion system protein ImpE